jgi:hypothetical protein
MIIWNDIEWTLRAQTVRTEQPQSAGWVCWSADWVICCFSRSLRVTSRSKIHCLSDIPFFRSYPLNLINPDAVDEVSQRISCGVSFHAPTHKSDTKLGTFFMLTFKRAPNIT